MFVSVNRWLKLKFARSSIGARCLCIVCDKNIRSFLPYKRGWLDLPPLMRELDIIGSDVNHYLCPSCASNDRERHLLMYLRASGLLSRMRDARILHIAPEAHLRNFIQEANPSTYIQGDLKPALPGVQIVDLHKIPHADESFDFVIANHVLEHVDDDHQALNEISRVLCTGGHAILQTPYSARLEKTFEDPGIESPDARLHAYGQEDHSRLYGRDIMDRFQASGLNGMWMHHDELLSRFDAIRYGVNRTEPFMLFVKSGS